MMARRSASAFCRRVGLSFSLGALLAAEAAPPRLAHPAPVRRSVVADALPTALPAPGDLLPGPEEERRARALAAYARAVIAEDNAESEVALESYRVSFDLDPANAELAIKLAWLYVQKNDAPTGIQLLKDAIKAAPKEPTPLIYLSQLYAKYLQKPEQALRYAEQALTLDSTFFPAYQAVYDLHLAAGQPARAEGVLQQASRSASIDSHFWLQLGALFQRTYLKEGKPGNPQPVNAIFRKAGELGKADAAVMAKVGNYFVETEQTKESIPYFLSALQLRQDSEDPVLVNAGEKAARALASTGQRDEAIRVLERLSKDNTPRYETYELLGELYEEKEDVDSALANYQHSLLLDASEPRNHIRVAWMQIRKKRYAEAVETARAARTRFPEDPQALYLLAIALTEAKRSNEAMVAYADALNAFENGHEEFLNAQFYFSYGAAAEQAGLTDKAVELMKKSIALAPNNSAQAYNFLGYMWVEKGENLEAAGEMIKKALESDADNGAFLDSYGWYQFKKGDFEEALKQLLKAAANTKAEDAVVMEHLGDTYQRLGRMPQALQYWQKALAIDAEVKGVAEKIDAAKQKISSAK